jgi:hypothetical protein
MAILALAGRISSGKDTVGKIIQKVLIKENATYLDERSDDYISQLTPEGLEYKSGWKVKKFAGKLKQVATLLTGVPLEKWEDQAFKESDMPKEWDYLKQMFENDENGEDGYATMPMTYRLFLQRLGTEAMRTGLHTNVWVNALFADYNLVAKKWNENGETTVSIYPKWIITDMRFPNEFAAVKERGGFCIKVQRPCEYCSGVGFHKMGCEDPNPNKRILHKSETALDGYTFDYVINNSGTIENLVVEVRKMLKHFKLISNV